MSGDWLKKIFAPGERAREVARQRAPDVVNVGKVVGVLLGGSDRAVEDLLSAAEKDVAATVTRAREREASIETTGELVGEVVDTGLDDDSGRRPLDRVVCKGCGRRQPIARDRPRTAREIGAALRARGWHTFEDAAWRCPGCAQMAGGSHG